MKKKAIIGGSILLVLILIGVSTSSSSNQETNQSPETQEAVVETTPAPKLEYEILERVENKLDEKISILIKPEEQNPKAIAEDVHKNCKKSCNISIYDDKEAFELDQQYSDLLGSNLPYDEVQNKLTKWKEDNYVFVAEHLVVLVGYGDSEGWGYGPYSEYPMKDWYYEELKGEK